MTTPTTKADDGGMIDDGGDAFPQHLTHDGEQLWQSCDLRDDWDRERTGMSLRDYFAGQVMAGHATKTLLDWQEAAEYAYHIADAMLAARKAGPQ